LFRLMLRAGTTATQARSRVVRMHSSADERTSRRYHQERRQPAEWSIVESSEANNERVEWVERDPEDVRFRVVIAPRGTSLRGGSGATDLVSVIVELVASAIVSSAAADGTWKVGALRTKRGVERFVHRAKTNSRDAAVAEAERIRRCIRDGDIGSI
jgi:hypothetical protein